MTARTCLEQRTLVGRERGRYASTRGSEPSREDTARSIDGLPQPRATSPVEGALATTRSRGGRPRAARRAARRVLAAAAGSRTGADLRAGRWRAVCSWRRAASKERVRPTSSSRSTRAMGGRSDHRLRTDLRPSECNSIFCSRIGRGARGAWSTRTRSRRCWPVTQPPRTAQITWHPGPRECSKASRASPTRCPPRTRDSNTPKEPEAGQPARGAFADPRFGAARAVLVRDHGRLHLGRDVLEAKRHTEVYHFLFEATVARRGRHMEDRT